MRRASTARCAEIKSAIPFRLSSIRFLETFEGHGWTMQMAKWGLGEGDERRTIGVFELRRVSS